MALAEMLGKFEWEVLENMTTEEYARWIAYLKICEQRRK